MSNRPITDLDELVKSEVCSHIKPFVEATMMEHEITRRKINDLQQTVQSINRVNMHDVIQYAAIAVLGLSMLVIRGC